MPPHRFSIRSLLVLLVAAAILALPWLAPPDGRERAALAQFAGRFHPLLVHLPIAFLALVPLMELAGCFRRWTHLRAAAGFVLGLAAAGAVVAALAGWLLAFSGGYEGSLVTRHLWGGTSLAVVGLFAAWTRRVCMLAGQDSMPVIAGRRARRPVLRNLPRLLYPSLLLVAVVLMVWTSHLGGQLTHGETYLTQHAPAPVRAWLGVPSPARTAGSFASEATFYDLRIAPIFESKCVTCHREQKRKGGLRLDTYEELMRGGDSGPVVMHGQPEHSELFRRITLPLDHEDFMPTDGKPPLRSDQITLIDLWIRGGASATQLPDAIAGAPAPVGEPPAPPPLAPDYRPHLAKIAALESTLGVRLVPQSAMPTDGLILRTAGSPSRCNDVALAQLASIAELVVDAELARTGVTDEGLASLGSWMNLRRIDLSHTAVTVAGVGVLVQLPRLYTLNLTATGIPHRALADLPGIRGIKQLHLFDPDSPESPQDPVSTPTVVPGSHGMDACGEREIQGED